MGSGRDAFATFYRDDLDRQAAWLQITSAVKVDSVTLLAAPPDSVLEVGCGTGAVIRGLRQRGFGRHHYGVDFSAEALATIPTDIRTAQADITVTPDPFGAGPYDLVVASHVVEHLEEPGRFLTGLRAIPHRQAVIEVPLEDLAATRLKNRFRDRTVHPAGHVQFFTPAAFRRLVEEGGLRIVGERIYVPVLPSAEAVRLGFGDAGPVKLALKNLSTRVLPRVARPIWQRWYQAHHAVLTEPA